MFETACFSRPPEEDLGWLKIFQLPKVFGTSVDYETITYGCPISIPPNGVHNPTWSIGRGRASASVRQVDEAGRSYIIGQRFRPSLEPWNYRHRVGSIPISWTHTAPKSLSGLYAGGICIFFTFVPRAQDDHDLITQFLPKETMTPVTSVEVVGTSTSSFHFDEKTCTWRAVSR